LKRLEKAYARNLHTQGKPVGRDTKFLCDEGLGGLCRWLRAFGYSCEWAVQLADSDILKWAERDELFFLTTDTLLMDFKLLRDGIVPSLWVPPTLKKREQFQWVKTKLQLSRQDSRCMKCNGELASISKETVLDRIPPKTRTWVDEYWECEKCGRLFWQGTHWEKISPELEKSDGVLS